ncbi:MAG: hypothetical protein DLM70_10155 [Chloroflexi bacterium]|nr:MAG: hypothetical protein DLM70_10155 [Chloroflexota bacterium]
MESPEFDEILKSAMQTGRLLAALLEGAADADVDFGKTIRNYPLWATAFAAGAGMLGGWWLGRKTLPQPPPKQLSAGESARALLEDSVAHLRRRVDDTVRSEHLERLLPESVDAERLLDNAGEHARAWINTVAEPRVKDGLQQLTANVSQGKIGDLLRQAARFVEMGDPDEGRK